MANELLKKLLLVAASVLFLVSICGMIILEIVETSNMQKFCLDAGYNQGLLSKESISYKADLKQEFVYCVNITTSNGNEFYMDMALLKYNKNWQVE